MLRLARGRLRRTMWLAALVVATGGCLVGSSTLSTTTTLTMITAVPETFVGSATCGTRLRRYVATIIDVTSGSMQTFSSLPTPCTKVASFVGTGMGQGVIPGDLYVGIIDGYDRDDIQAESDSGDPTRSFRQMLDSSGNPVSPRWTTTCGQAVDGGVVPADATADAGAVSTNPLLSPVQAKASTEVFLLGCIPFTDPSPPADGGTDATNDAAQDGG